MEFLVFPSQMSNHNPRTKMLTDKDLELLELKRSIAALNMFIDDDTKIVYRRIKGREGKQAFRKMIAIFKKPEITQEDLVSSYILMRTCKQGLKGNCNGTDAWHKITMIRSYYLKLKDYNKRIIELSSEIIENENRDVIKYE